MTGGVLPRAAFTTGLLLAAATAAWPAGGLRLREVWSVDTGG